MYIEVRDESQEGLDKAIKEFTRRVKKEGLLNELRNKEFYLSPSKRRRFKKKEAMKRRIQEAREDRKVKKYQRAQSFTEINSR